MGGTMRSGCAGRCEYVEGERAMDDSGQADLGKRLDRWMGVIAEAGLDGWLVADFRWNNPLFARLLGLQSGILTRRAFLWLPAAGQGEPCVIASQVDGHTVAGVACKVSLYSGYEEMAALLS